MSEMAELLGSYGQIAVVLFLGLVLGSFASAVTWRSPQGIPWAFPEKSAKERIPRSCCPSCGATLGVVDLVPVFSWMFLRGRCRHCKKEIGCTYPAIELAVTAGALGVFSVWGFSLESVFIMMTLPFLAALFVIDTRQMILPDQLVAILFFLGLIHLAWAGADSGFSAGYAGVLADRLSGALLYPGILWGAGYVVSRLKGKESLGFGDVKFVGMAGIWLGSSYLPFFMMLSGLCGIAWGLAWRLLAKSEIFPFGPALIAALCACMAMKGLNVNVWT